MTMMMPISERRLDLRDFQDIVDEARKLIPRYCPEWTDHNISDPGITLIELFAWMTEMILYQVNRVPDEMYEKFLELIGVQRLPPQPAQTEVSFYLSAPLTRPITIGSDTEIATDRTEVQEAIVFTTTRDLTIVPPVLAGLRAWREGQGFEDYMPYVTSGLVEAALFNEQPVEGDALYAGYEGDLAGRSLLLRMSFDELEGSHIDPRNPPLVWEYWSELTRGWAPLRLLDQSGTGTLRDIGAVDPTFGLNRSGDVYINIPFDSKPQTIDGIPGTWVRVRYVNKDGQGYTTSPRLSAIKSECIGGTVPARQAQLVRDEFLGKSDGSPAQSFPVAFRPIIKQRTPHVIEAELDDEITDWLEVEDFAETTEADRHFMIHYPTGEVRFGPAVRGRDGIAVQYGAIPRKDAVMRLVEYRSGGGIIGNVGEGTITQLKTSLPYIAGVTNYRGAIGGLNDEGLEQAKMRALGVLKRPMTAVTREDYERVALEVEGVGRARCLAAGENGNQIPGVIRLLLVPNLPEAMELTAEALAPSPSLIQAVSEELDDRKSLGTVVQLEPAPLTWVELDAHIYVRRGSDAEAMQEAAVRRLRTMFHPTPANGARNPGFGGTITVSQVAGVLQSMPGVVYIERVRLRRNGNREEVTRVQPPPDSLLVLGRCYVLAEVIDE